jgi:hypothetical protein
MIPSSISLSSAVHCLIVFTELRGALRISWLLRARILMMNNGFASLGNYFILLRCDSCTPYSGEGWPENSCTPSDGSGKAAVCLRRYSSNQSYEIYLDRSLVLLATLLVHPLSC